MQKEKVIVGLSGGVDSTVCAYLLKQQGYEVIGITLDLWDSSNGEKALKDGKRVADLLEIPHTIVERKADFKNIVVDHFADSYLKGLTPNPCIVCNPNIKFDTLLKKAQEEGATKIATGHYARIEQHPTTGRFAIKNSATATKDQTYALYRLTQPQLKAMLLPIGEYEKDDIRKIAQEVDSYIAEKKDSQDICFIPDGEYANFIKEQKNPQNTAGNFVDLDGNILGKHNGLLHYTIGQRKGLGLAFGSPRYVYALRPDSNEVVICTDDELFQTTLQLEDLSYMAYESFSDGLRLQAKIRYSHQKSWCTISNLEDGRIQCVFDELQRAITPGQSVVFYDGDFVAGGGIISAS